VNSAGIRIRTYDKQPSGEKKGVVILVHGFSVHAMFEFLSAVTPGGKHCVYEGSLPQKLVSLGFSVWTYDAQGHGLSGGFENLRGYFNHFEDLVDDLLLFTSLVKKQEQTTLPFFACGSSMGGGVLTKAVRRDPTLVSGIVLLAPMLSLEKISKSSINKALLPFGSFASTYTPWARLMLMQVNPNAHCREEFLNDSLCDTSRFIRARTSWECYLFATEMIRNCQQVTTPFLAIHSENDSLVDPDSSQTLFRDAQTTDKEYFPVNHMWHVLLHEEGADKVREKVAEWFSKRITSN
jgi:acylglycerol lipase